MERSKDIEIEYEGITLLVLYEFDKGEESTLVDPGHGDSVLILKVSHQGVDISDFFFAGNYEDDIIQRILDIENDPYARY